LTHPALQELDAWTRRWIDYEQTLNDRVINERWYYPIDERSNDVRSQYRPDCRDAWRQLVVWLPREQARLYGPVLEAVRRLSGEDSPPGRVPLLVHPQAPVAHQRVVDRHGLAAFSNVWVTPTASYRSVVAWRPGVPAMGLKLSLGARVGNRRRSLREDQVVRAVLMTSVFDTIPDAHRRELGLDWFADRSGLVAAESRQGYIVREFPKRVAAVGDEAPMPAFSLVARQGGRPSWLTELIRRSGTPPEEFVIDRLVRPFVHAAAYLLFVQGIQAETHLQNVLVELDADGDLTGRLVLRDFQDTTVSPPIRVARHKELPVPNGWTAVDAPPFRLASTAIDYFSNFGRPVLRRGGDMVERYGLWGYIWVLNVALERDFADYDSVAVERAYLELWQEQTRRFLGVTPDFCRDGHGIATDEAIAEYLRLQDWRHHGATGGHTLPEAVEPFVYEPRARRRPGPIYDRLETGWGDIFLFGDVPVFFRPAF
jgi:hypothetical protein